MDIATDNLRAKTISKIVDWVKAKGYRKIKAQVDGFDTPSSFTRSETEGSFVPDVTAMRRDRKNYFEVAIKSDDPKRVIRKWKLLSTIAAMKNGKLFLFAPRGHKAFAQRIVKERHLNAEVISI